MHLSVRHGVVPAPKARKERVLALLGGKLNCPFCEFIGKSLNGIVIHMSSRHKSQLEERSKEIHLERTTEAPRAQLAVARKNGHTHQEIEGREIDPNGIPHATLALGLGRFQGLCGAMAQEFDLPPRRFAAALAGLIYTTQIR
jgi:hypothetical protein